MNIICSATAGAFYPCAAISPSNGDRGTEAERSGELEIGKDSHWKQKGGFLTENAIFLEEKEKVHKITLVTLVNFALEWAA
jgi:hypothetical protein